MYIWITETKRQNYACTTLVCVLCTLALSKTIHFMYNKFAAGR